MGISEGGVASLHDLELYSTRVLTRQTNMQLVIVSASGGRQARNRQVLLELCLPIQLNQF